ncbi:MAG TPA: hypothetical protein VFK12_00865 [Gammaproteobacteria bacterium]|jgi:hypothetical protein|nr:hypothetical protein [Gammaproteobacteria bacterium]
MSAEKLLTLWSSSPTVSAIIWLVLLIVVLYVARIPAHRLLRNLGGLLYRGMRLSAKALMRTSERLSERNREVMLVQAREHQVQRLQREFERVAAYVNRDLSAYPALNRQLSEMGARVEEDFQRSGEVPPMPPPWVEAVNSIAKIPANGDPMVGTILRNVQDMLDKSSKDVVGAYRKAAGKRHELLQRMLPMWRYMNRKLESLEKMFAGLGERTQKIDNQIARLEEIIDGTDHVEETLKSSAVTQFFIATLLLGVTIVGGVINFNLIAMPMSEMVGGASYIGPFHASDVAALMLVAMEISVGVFLMDSLRFTHLFPAVGTMEDKMRRRVLVLMLVFLTILACIESSLGFMRNLLAADKEALIQQLAGGTVATSAAFQYRWLPSLAQMVLGFILPFLLAWAAIPLEMFVHSGRTVGGLVSASALRVSAFGLRLVGNIAESVSRLLVTFYDTLVSPMLLGERWIHSLRTSHAHSHKKTA